MIKMALFATILGWLCINILSSIYFITNAEEGINDCMNVYVNSWETEATLYKLPNNWYHVDTKELDIEAIWKAKWCIFYWEDKKYIYRFILNSLHCWVAKTIL